MGRKTFFFIGINLISPVKSDPKHYNPHFPQKEYDLKSILTVLRKDMQHALVNWHKLMVLDLKA